MELSYRLADRSLFLIRWTGFRTMNRKLKFKGSLRRYFRWPFYLTILLIIITVAIFFIDVRAGAVAAEGVGLYVLLSVLMMHKSQNRILKEFVSFGMKFKGLEQQILHNMELPAAILDDRGKIIWTNHAFSLITGNENDNDRGINVIFPALSVKNLPTLPDKETVEETLTYGDNLYRAVMKCVSVKEIFEETDLVEGLDDKTEIVILSLIDETELQTYIRKNEEEKAVLALAYLDNYDEALQSVEEVRQSLLIALIDRKMTRYFSDVDAIVRKIEKDKYFIVMRKNSLQQLMEEKFQILNEVKAVNIGNEMAVTLSIGVGLGSSAFLQNYEYSRIAIEMALGRGGDQVVVKDGNDVSYFGGKALQVEKNTRVKARVKAQALKEFMSSKDRVVVMGHKITDVDALGAAIGIYRAGKTVGKPVHIVVNDPTTSIRPLMADYLDNPEYEPTMFVDSSQAKDLVDNNTVVIVVDTNKPTYTECPDLLQRTKTIVVLDHHRRGSEVIENAVLSYVEPYASSTCEMVAEILQYFYDGLKLRNIEADCLYAGIIIDTNNFTTRSGVRTFEAAAFLRRNGADVTRVRKMLRDNLESYKARAEAVRSSHIYRNSYAIARCPSEGLESPTVVGAQAANELLNISGVKASFVMTSYNNEIYISARAIDEVNVQLMMEKLGGGGHLNVAGAQVKTGMDEAEEILKKIIDESIEENDSTGGKQS